MNKPLTWKVCPVQGRQLKDVRKEDLYGDFRLCDTYRGGGGYDQFPGIYKKRKGVSLEELNRQFVVQLFGCPLDCPYCYVTRDGIFGKSAIYTSTELVKIFHETGQKIFHLMGGAPGLYLEKWYDIVDRLEEDNVFHSDLLLVEKLYDYDWLASVAKENVLLAVDIKGVTPEDFKKNTGRDLYEEMFWRNFDTVVKSGVDFYLTFTNPALSYIEEFKERLIKRYGEWVLDDSFSIDLIEYEALK